MSPSALLRPDGGCHIVSMLSWRRHRSAPRREEEPTEGARFVRECAALLDGQVAFERLAGGENPRAAEWVNLLAHGSLEDLHRLIDMAPASSGFPKAVEWHSAAQFLAQAVTNEVDGGALSLRRLQQTLLIPLELEMMGTDAPEPWPDATVRLVLAYLASQRSRRP